MKCRKFRYVFEQWGRTQLGFENRGEYFFDAPESTKEHQLCKTKQRLTYVGIHERPLNVMSHKQ